MSSDEQAIREVQKAWLEATEEGDTGRLLTLMTEDAVFLTPGRPPFGRDEFTKSFAAGLQHVRITCGGEFEEVVVVEDVAYVRGHLWATVTPIAGGEGTQHLSGYTLSVFRKQVDGRWLLARDANLIVPAAR